MTSSQRGNVGASGQKRTGSIMTAQVRQCFTSGRVVPDRVADVTEMSFNAPIPPPAYISGHGIASRPSNASEERIFMDGPLVVIVAVGVVIAISRMLQAMLYQRQVIDELRRIGDALGSKDRERP